MADISPLRGYLYNPSKVSLPDVIAPPYDVISPEQQSQLYDTSPYNVVRLILGREEDRYTSAAQSFDAWKRENILVRDATPAFYFLHQTFDDGDGKQITRKGFIARCRLEEFEKKIVLPHEKTLAKPREDRFKLFKATDANFSQVFSLYSDPTLAIDTQIKDVAKNAPAIDVVFEEVRNKLWRLQDEHTIRAIQSAMSDKQILIADGHHRYETALAYREYKRSQNPSHTGSEPYNDVMMFLTNIDDPGLVIFPTHRLVHSLPYFDVQSFLSKLERYFIMRSYREYSALHEGLKSSSAPAFGLAMQQDPILSLLTLKPTPAVVDLIQDLLPAEVKELDVTILHTLVLRDILGVSLAAQEQKTNLNYVKDAWQAVEQVEQKKAQLAFLMKPTKIEQVRAVAKAGHTMPQKSTYFYPKLLSGLVINSLTE